MFPLFNILIISRVTMFSISTIKATHIVCYIPTCLFQSAEGERSACYHSNQQWAWFFNLFFPTVFPDRSVSSIQAPFSLFLSKGHAHLLVSPAPKDNTTCFFKPPSECGFFALRELCSWLWTRNCRLSEKLHSSSDAGGPAWHDVSMCVLPRRTRPGLHRLP